MASYAIALLAPHLGHKPLASLVFPVKRDLRYGGLWGILITHAVFHHVDHLHDLREFLFACSARPFQEAIEVHGRVNVRACPELLSDASHGLNRNYRGWCTLSPNTYDNERLPNHTIPQGHLQGFHEISLLRKLPQGRRQALPVNCSSRDRFSVEATSSPQ